MSEEKKEKSWAGILPNQSDEDQKKLEEMLNEQDKHMMESVAVHQAKLEQTVLELMASLEDQNNRMLDLLNKIHGEMVKANAMIPEIAYPDNTPTKPETTSPPPKKDLTKPDNVGNEEKIINYYNNIFLNLTANGGIKMDAGIVSKFTYGFEQDKIIMKTNSFFPTPLFAALASKIEKELNGKYISGKGAHFILPYP